MNLTVSKLSTTLSYIKLIMKPFVSFENLEYIENNQNDKII